MKVILIWKILAILVTDKELIFLIYKDIPESIRKKKNRKMLPDRKGNTNSFLA